MLILDEANLQNLQRYVSELEIERGLEKTGYPTKVFTAGEKVGKHFKAIRKP
jgi:hypothetical protein